MGDSHMSNYPPIHGGAVSPNAPPPGVNIPLGPVYPPSSEPGQQLSGYPPAAGYPAYPSTVYPQPSGEYVPPSGYPQPVAGDYPPPSGYHTSASPYNYPPTMTPGPYPPAGTMMQQPTATSGYPAPQVQADPAGNWMPPPTVSPVCPRGLEYLTLIDQLLVKQKVELLEAFTSFETKNKYTIKNSLGQNVYTAKEDTDCLTRNCLGTIRPFDIKIKDNVGQEVIHINRPLRCDSCLCPCCLQKVEVMAPPGVLVGSVIQEWSILAPTFRIENAAGERVLRIEGPICTFSICGDVEFKVLSVDGSVEVGKITKQWSGLLREAFTDADHFGISFPMDLDVNMKAVLLGACFLIDFMFFEKQGNKEDDRIGML